MQILDRWRCFLDGNVDPVVEVKQVSLFGAGCLNRRKNVDILIMVP